MKILHVVDKMEMGGIENLIFSILRKDTDNTYVLAIHGSREETFNNWPALAAYSDHFIFANKKEGFQFDVTRRIKKSCQTLAISVIHSHHIGPLIYSSLASRSLKGLKHVHTQHDIWHLQNKKYWLIEYLLLQFRKDIHIVAVSNNIADYMRRLFPKSKVDLVYNGIDTDRFKPWDKQKAREALQLPLDTSLIATAGRVEKIKGQRYLIQALLELPQSYCLVIAGNGRGLSTLQKESEALNLASRVFFLKQIEQIELVYQACDLFCLPSLDEGLPLAILEAQACNVPVICSDVGSCAEGIDKASGQLVPPADPKAIAKACLTITRPVTTPRDFILAQFSLAALIEKYQAIYLS